MSGLQGLFIRKIIVTLVCLCIPLLLFPREVYVYFGIPMEDSMIFMRLLGVAYLALCVGYFSAITALKSNQKPTAIIDMGLVSNGLAALVFLFYGATGSWQNWNLFAQVYMWLIMLGAFYICIGLFKAKNKYKNA